MDLFQSLTDRAKADPRHIVLAEGEDSRIQEAAIAARKAGVAEITLLGNQTVIEQALGALGGLDLGIMIKDPALAVADDPQHQWYHQKYLEKNFSKETTLKSMQQSLYFANTLVGMGSADGSVAGAHYTTAETVRAALLVIGPRPGVSLVSSFFLMLVGGSDNPFRGGYVFSDCGMVVDPDAPQLAQIASDAADSYATLMGDTAKVAMLSFTTDGSARHESVDKVVEATALLKEARSDLAIAGDIQLDAAIVPAIGQKKASNYPFGSENGEGANVLIFPNLHAGNIGYKLVERFAGADAIGPILQGLAKPANDLSRGCTADDVFKAVVITVVQAQAAS